MKQGVYKITNDNYHNHFCDEPTLSRGVITDLLSSPAKAWWNHPQLNPLCAEPSNERKFDLGSAVHDYVLEGGNAVHVVFGYDDWKTKAAREEAERANKNGKIPLLEKQFVTVKKISDSVIATIKNCTELGITDLQTDGDAELSYIWQEDGVWLKIRPDWISNDKRLILDIKTTGKSAHPDEFSRHAADMGYDIQDAIYKRGVKAIDGVNAEFIFIVVETSEPYLCCPVGLSAEFQELGRQKVDAGIALWKHCLKTGRWPGYITNRVCWTEVKPWSIAAWESKKFDIERMIR